MLELLSLLPLVAATRSPLARRRTPVIGIHTPAFERERVLAAVRAKPAEFALEPPVMIHNDFADWNGLGDSGWQTFDLIDKRGRNRDRVLGETHASEPQALRIDHAVEALLAE